MPFIEANGVSINYEVAGARGPVVVLLHELGGTLHSWDAVAPRLAERFRVLRYDQRGSGLSEKVRQEFTNDTLVDDLEALLKATAPPPPYHFVTVAAAATQSLRFLEKHPDQVGSLVLCNPAPGVDPSRAGGARRARRIRRARGHARGVCRSRSTFPIRATLGERAAYEAYRGRYLGQRSGRLRLRLPRAGAHQHAAHAAADPLPRHGRRRPPRHGAAARRHAPSWRRKFPAHGSS